MKRGGPGGIAYKKLLLEDPCKATQIELCFWVKLNTTTALDVAQQFGQRGGSGLHTVITNSFSTLAAAIVTKLNFRVPSSCQEDGKQRKGWMDTSKYKPARARCLLLLGTVLRQLAEQPNTSPSVVISNVLAADKGDDLATKISFGGWEAGASNRSRWPQQEEAASTTKRKASDFAGVAPVPDSMMWSAKSSYNQGPDGKQKVHIGTFPTEAKAAKAVRISWDKYAPPNAKQRGFREKKPVKKPALER
jgi:hypothetical protein